MRRIALVLFLMTATVVGIVLAADSSVEANPGFKLPWSAGETYEVRQTRGGPTHDCPGYNCYAYDFSLPLGTPVTALSRLDINPSLRSDMIAEEQICS